MECPETLPLSQTQDLQGWVLDARLTNPLWLIKLLPFNVLLSELLFLYSHSINNHGIKSSCPQDYLCVLHGFALLE